LFIKKIFIKLTYWHPIIYLNQIYIILFNKQNLITNKLKGYFKKFRGVQEGLQARFSRAMQKCLPAIFIPFPCCKFESTDIRYLTKGCRNLSYVNKISIASLFFNLILEGV